MTKSVVIATRNRPEPLRECLTSLAGQSQLPETVVVVDASDGEATQWMVAQITPSVPYGLVHLFAEVRSAAAQRNQGARLVNTDLVFFLDDDVVLERDFISEIVKLFQQDTECTVGGVGGTIINEVYAPPSKVNSFLLRLCIGPAYGSYSGRLLGPAMNFLPQDDSVNPQRVDWLRSGCSAYRTEVFRRFWFAPSFHGYSFAEDVHLSAQIAKEYQLFSTGRARLYHRNLGGQTHRDWVGLGEMIFCNRHEIMVHVLERHSISDYARLVFSEFIYGSLASVWNGGRVGNVRRTALMTLGKLRGLAKIVAGNSPHDSGRGAAARTLFR